MLMKILESEEDEIFVHFSMSEALWFIEVTWSSYINEIKAVRMNRICSWYRETRNVYKILVVNPPVKRHL